MAFFARPGLQFHLEQGNLPMDSARSYGLGLHSFLLRDLSSSIWMDVLHNGRERLLQHHRNGDPSNDSAS